MESRNVSLWLCFALTSMVLGISLAQTWTPYKQRNNCGIKADFIIERQISGSLLVCVLICTKTGGCISVSWNAGTNSCLLSGHDTISEENDPTYRAYEMASGSVCASEVKFPVFMAKKTTYGTARYEMTYQDAEKRCAELGTSMATEDDVTQAQSLGLHYCDCGWLSNGRNALILSYYDGNCWGSFYTGPIYCDWALTDVWCKN
ncbi:uncharacterized protein LOC123537485 [Mercenaria mercenaria]|uniref:uncharacterized protein LOC123537485 n=1 Tax=Mercenaria mercenaria TaxID=6596 RepID=UPI00234F0FA0|nr:uncharacterized protein LOC123537485 [Mercenaria mercenaria]